GSGGVGLVRDARGGARRRAGSSSDARNRADEAALRRGGDLDTRGAARARGGGAGRGGADRRLPGGSGGVRREAGGALQRELRRVRISPSSGQRPSLCFEKISSPSAKTSYWDFSPSRAEASIPVSLSSAARLAARRSYPL